jgi:hypothetical protein
MQWTSCRFCSVRVASYLCSRLCTYYPTWRLQCYYCLVLLLHCECTHDTSITSTMITLTHHNDDNNRQRLGRYCGTSFNALLYTHICIISSAYSLSYHMQSHAGTVLLHLTDDLIRSFLDITLCNFCTLFLFFHFAGILQVLTAAGKAQCVRKLMLNTHCVSQS